MSESNHITLPLFPEETQEQEIWKDIPDWEGVYQASTLGRVRRIKDVPCAHARSGTIRNPEINKKTGYHRITLTDKPRRVRVSLHRLILATFVGPPPSKGMHVDHVSGVKSDNRLRNLEYVTPLENRQRACALGLHDRGHSRTGDWATGERNAMRRYPEKVLRGSKNANAKLTEDQVREIRSRVNDTGASLAAEFHMGESSIVRIRRRQSWTHVID